MGSDDAIPVDGDAPVSGPPPIISRIGSALSAPAPFHTILSAPLLVAHDLPRVPPPELDPPADGRTDRRATTDPAETYSSYDPPPGAPVPGVEAPAELHDAGS